ncbi:TRAM domain-containing protein [Candidatus Bathyarchaeota archaeon]|nr:MAG: TRAM domain-containing protein [Candidatus Bathyarchaeota archaeon]TEU04951.1 MAG: TRAM domain-containing protein [Candidatus Bathyarchaeota archaeon]
MPRRLSEKPRHVRPRRKHKRERKFNAIPFQPVPVRKGQEIDVVINDIGTRGDGIARIQNFLIFVPQVKVGERVKVKIVSVGKKFAIAEKINRQEETF